MTNEYESEAERDSVTKPTVVRGLGFPLGREEESPEPTGWQVPANSQGETTEI